jgi:hypothetical protein
MLIGVEPFRGSTVPEIRDAVIKGEFGDLDAIYKTSSSSKTI